MDNEEKASEAAAEQEQVQDDDLLSSPTTESHSETPEDLVISTISRPLALSLATVFEEVVDKLAVVGFTLATPAVDARTKDSVDYSERYNMPVLHESIISDKNEQETWMVHQHHTSHIPRRLDYLVDPKLETRQSATDIMKRSGIKCSTQSEKNQKIRVQIQLMANVLVTELVMDASFDSLINQIEMENKEKADREEQYLKVNMYKQYIQSVKAAIKETRQQKEEETALQEIEIHNLNDLLLEQDIRSNMEDKYIKKLGASKVAAVHKTNLTREALQAENYQKMTTTMQLENIVHESMLKIIGEKLVEMSALHDTVVDKYEKDFYRMTTRLEALCTARKKDLERIAWLQRRIVDYERIVLDDRRIKKKAEDKLRQKQTETKKAVKIQAWWRGTMVRRWMGSYMRLFAELYDRRAMRREAKAHPKGRPRPKK